MNEKRYKFFVGKKENFFKSKKTASKKKKFHLFDIFEFILQLNLVKKITFILIKKLNKK